MLVPLSLSCNRCAFICITIVDGKAHVRDNPTHTVSGDGLEGSLIIKGRTT